MKKNQILAAIGAVLLISVIGIVLFFMFQPKTATPIEETKVAANPFVSKDPRVVARNFITYSGNMGKLPTLEDLKNGNHNYQSQLNRKESYLLTKNLLAEGPLKNNGQDSYIDELHSALFVYFVVDTPQILVGEPKDSNTIRHKTTAGEVNRNVVTVPVSFTSKMIVYTYATDSVENKEYVPESYSHFVKELQVQLINIDGKWYVYQILNPEIVTNRLSTFDGRGDQILGERKVLPALR